MRKFTIIVALLFSGVTLGWLSARFMMQNAAGAAGSDLAGWTEIRLTGDDLRPTYEAGYYLWRGKVLPPSNVRLFRRVTDDEGNTLRGDCAVQLEGKIPDARWWVVNLDGSGVSGAISAGTAIREMSGDAAITVSQSPVPGNWIKPGSSTAYALQLVLQDLTIAPDQTPTLPSVKRLWC